MSDLGELDRDGLPTPLAQLLARIESEGLQGPVQRFDSAAVAGEAILKWLHTVAVSHLSAHDPARGRSAGRATVRENGLGSWLGQLQRVSDRLTRSQSRSSVDFATHLRAKHREQTGATEPILIAAASTRAVLTQLADPTYTGFRRRQHSALDVLDDLVFIRNRTRGHGAQLSDFFASIAGEMEQAIVALVRGLPPTAVWWSFTENGVAIPLVGESPMDSGLSLAPFGVPGPGTYLLIDARPFPVAPLARVELEPASCSVSFGNGRWNESGAICEFLCYSSGRTSFAQIAAYADPTLDLEASETSARPVLDWTDNCAHNLPRRPSNYVERKELESVFHRLLADKQHRMLTLQGGGGMGKTALTLTVLWDLIDGQDDFGFDMILWFSARDIDLHTTGPTDRRRDITDLDSIAVEFTRLVGDTRDDVASAREILRTAISSDTRGTPRYLLVIDNLETIESAGGLQEFFDNNVTLPNKVIFTSRHDYFQGDYRLPVGGMSDDEARALLIGEARRGFFEPRMTPQIQASLIEATGARAYALRLAASQFGRGTAIADIKRTLHRGDILAALFERSFEALSDDARFLYLLLGAIGRSTPEAVLRATLRIYHRDFDEAASELERTSMATRDDARAARRQLRLPEMAVQHARERLAGHKDEVEVRSLRAEILEWTVPIPGRDPLQGFSEHLMAAVRKARPGAPEHTRLLAIAESAADDLPALWAYLAPELEAAGADLERTRDAFRRATGQADADDANIWKQWAAFEERAGFEENYVLHAIRAVEARPGDLAYASRVAYDLSGFLQRNKDSWPHVRRRFIFQSVREAMQTRWDDLTATDLSRLGWLYLNEYDPQSPDQQLMDSARRCAEAGLYRENGNYDCESLLARCR